MAAKPPGGETKPPGAEAKPLIFFGTRRKGKAFPLIMAAKPLGAEPKPLGAKSEPLGAGIEQFPAASPP